MRAGTGRVGSVVEKRSRKSFEKLRKVKLADAVTSRQPVPLSYGQNVNTAEIFFVHLKYVYSTIENGESYGYEEKI